jgi:hypothetical protein
MIKGCAVKKTNKKKEMSLEQEEGRKNTTNKARLETTDFLLWRFLDYVW